MIDWTDDSPLRLAEAACRAFPDGSMKVAGLRREAARGHLVIERIAGKDYTTLAAIKAMRDLCRVVPVARVTRRDVQGVIRQDGLPTPEDFAASTEAAQTTLDGLRRPKKAT